MRYIGGKYRIAEWVAEHLLRVRGDCTHYLEPFVGAASVFERVAPHFEHAIAADAHEDLILMWQAVAEGWEPPGRVSREQWFELRDAPPSALRGFVGFGASYSGRWFSAHVDRYFNVGTSHQMDFPGAAKDSVERIASVVSHASILWADYREHMPGPESLVYCDPPYAGTIDYPGTNFDSGEFWQTADLWARRGAVVVVSEQGEPPAGWEVLAERSRKAMFRVVRDLAEQPMRTERLFWRPRA